MSKTQWKKRFIRNRTMLTFHLRLWEYLIFDQKVIPAIKSGQWLCHLAASILKGLCNKELYVCRTKTETDMTFTSLFFPGTMLLYQMWHLEKKIYPEELSRLSSFWKNTLIYRMKHYMNERFSGRICYRNVIPDCSNWVWKGFIRVCWCIIDMYYIVLKTGESVKGLIFTLVLPHVFFSTGFLEGLPQWNPECGGVQENLRQFLPLRWCLQVRWARLPNFWHQRRRNDRLPGVHHRLERDVTGQAGAEAEVGLQHVWPGRKRVHQPRGDAGDCTGEQETLGNEVWFGTKEEELRWVEAFGLWKGCGVFFTAMLAALWSCA